MTAESSALPIVTEFAWTAGTADTFVGAVVPFRGGAPMSGDPVGQVGVLFDMLRAALAENGASPERLLQVIFYVTDMGLREEINRHWAAWPGHHTASRAVIGVAELGAPGLVIESTFTATREG